MLKKFTISILSLAAIFAEGAASAQTAAVNAGTVYQTIDGFGASTGYVERNNNMNSTQAAAYFSPSSGIGLSWDRIQDCGSDADCGANYGSTTYTPDLPTLQLAASYGVKTLITFDFPTCDSGNYPSMATYAVARLNYLKSQGITIGAIGPENEPGNGNDCTAATLATWIDYLGGALASNSITIPIAMPESNANYAASTSPPISPAAYTTCFTTDPTCASYVTYGAQHGYSTWLGPSVGPPFPHYTPVPSAMGSRHNWQTEVNGNITGADTCNGGQLGVLDLSMADGLAWAQNIFDFYFNGGGSLWMYWNLQSGYTDTGDPNGCNDGLSDYYFNPAKRFYVLGQFSKFVSPGMTVISATQVPQSGVEVMAFENQSTGAFVIAALNTNSSAVTQPFSLTGLTAATVTPYITDPSNNIAAQSPITISSYSFSATLTASSLTTFVSSTSGGGGEGGGGGGGGAGNCPTSAPAGMTVCRYVDVAGSDSNDGLSETSGHPWLHAPGMPAATGTAAAFSAGTGGVGIILRGGDTWHEGNSSATPYTGGTWDLYDWFNSYNLNDTACVFEGSQSGCLYVGYDPTWSSTTAGARPIITGDNAATGLTSSAVGSCSYQVTQGSSTWGANDLVDMGAWTIFDSIELTGLCVNQTTIGSTSSNAYFAGWASSGTYNPISILHNTYAHGWSATASAGTGGSSLQHPVTIYSGGGGVHQVFDATVVDGSDSYPDEAAWAAFPWFYHVRHNIFRYVGNGSGADCHDIHDNIFEHLYYTLNDGHYNALECNADHSGSTPNVFYNNVFQHFDPSFGNGETVWFCPNTTPEFWFNNILQDTNPAGVGQPWNIAGPPSYSGCTNSGGQQMFNNTFVDQTMGQPCYLGAFNNSDGQYLTVFNELLINSPWQATGSPQCAGYTSATNISLSDAGATTQGYTTGTAGTVSANQCALNASGICGPASTSNSSVGAGSASQLSAAAAQLATYTAEPAIAVDAAAAVLSGTTDGWTYNSATHTMTGPAQSGALRGSTPDSGAQQYSSGSPSYTVTIVAPSNGTITGESCTTTNTYPSGTPYSCTATANPGYLFTGWTSGPCAGTTLIPCTGTITANLTIAAGFAASVPVAGVAPTSLAFGSQSTGTTSAAERITVSNTGAAALAFAGTPAFTTGTQFAIATNSCGTSLPAGESCLITVAFSPTSAGSKTDTLTITDNSGGTPGATQTVSVAGTGVSGATWTYGANVHNLACSGSSVGTMISCSAEITLSAGQSLEGGVAAWNLNAPATWSAVTGDAALVHPSGCAASGTSAAKNFYSDVFYILADAGGTYTITATLDSTASTWNMDLELVPVNISAGTAAYAGCAEVGYTASSPGCLSSACVSPSGLSLTASSNAVFSEVALGYGTPSSIGSPWTYDPDSSNVDAAFAWAPNLASVPQITWDSTHAANYPAASVMALEPAPTTFTWTQSVVPAASGTITGTNAASGSYALNTSIGPLTATAAAGYSFLHWASATGDATCSGTVNPAPLFLLQENSACTADFAQIAATPVFSPPAGPYAGTPVVGISTATTGATIYYTTDGSTPSCTHGTPYSAPITVAAGELIQAISCGADYAPSAVGSAAYTISGLTPGQPAALQLIWAAGN